MSIGNINFDEITEQDLKSLIDVGVPEGLNIEYKRDLYGNADLDKKEALKDISSFANSLGGHLIIGMAAEGAVPIELSGLKGNPDLEIQRLENLVRDGIEPRITGVKIRPVSLASGGFAIVVRIPRSWNPPHRVRAKGHNRFYIRNSAGVHEVSVEELRALFNLSATAHDRVKAFRRERLALLAADEGPKRIAGGGRLILHIVPLSAFGHAQSLDVKQMYEKHESFRPISAMGLNGSYNFNGVIVFSGGDKCYGYTQIFRNGTVEATKAGVIREREGIKRIPSLTFDESIFEVLPGYLNGLKALEVPPPLVIMISLQDIYKAKLGVGYSIQEDDWDSITLNASELLLPEIIIEDYGTEQDYQKAMRPAFDALWNAFGFAGSRYFNAEGVWIGTEKQ